MTFEERMAQMAANLERFERDGVERHEAIEEKHQALAQSVELLAHLQIKTEERLLKNEILLGEVMESVNSLARIAHAHEQRITGLEDRA
jgi:hypothetical protein